MTRSTADGRGVCVAACGRLVYLGLALGMLHGCGGEPISDDSTIRAEPERSALMVETGSQPWTGNGRVVPACWMQAGQQPAGVASPVDWSAMRGLIETQVGLTWARVTNVRFTWTASCPVTGTQKFVRISVLGKTVLDKFGWDGGTTRGNGTALLHPPVAFNPATPTFGDSVNFVFRADGLGQTSTTRATYMGVHEFGHVLGFGHEQDRSDNGGACTNSVGSDPTAQLLTGYDQQSVMNYCGPNNGKLTASDVLGVRKYYGYRNAGDFDRDSQRDVLWHNRNTGVVKYWGMQGTAARSFPADMTGTIPTAWRVAGTGDFNNDGEADLVWQNSTTGESKLWLLNAGVPTGFPGPFATGVTAEWMIRAIGDVNGDGQPDIIWQSSTTGTGKAWLMQNGMPTAFPAPFATNIPLDWKIVGSGDFNGDGTDDVVWQNKVTGQSKVWIMTNGSPTAFPAPFATGVPPEWEIRAIGDYSGDNFPDVVWTNTLTGQSKVWVLTSASLSSGFPAPFATNIPSEWEIVGP